MKQKSFEELQLLVEQNNSDAMYELGSRYLSGNGVPKDYEKAVNYFRKAETARNIKGTYGIAKCYFYGKGLKQDYEKAYNIFYDLMTKYNDIDSKYYVGLMYYLGYFVKQNYEMAYNIFKELSDNGDKGAKRRIADMYYFGQYLPRDYTKAFEIFKDLYENQNDKYSLMMLSDMYYHGYGTEQNFKKAKELGELFEQNDNDKNTAYFLGEIYYYGKDTDINYEKAINYFEKALDERYDDAYYYLGQIYQNGGYGVEKDIEKSRNYLFKVEKDLCQATLYYIMALGKYDLKTWIETLNYNKNMFGDLLKYFPKNHISITYFNKLKTLRVEQYNQMAENLKPKITKFFEQKQPYFSINNVESEEEVDILSEVIINSYEYQTMDDYLGVKLDKENDKRLLYMVGCMFYEGRGCQKDKQEGINWITKSAEQGYPYAIYKIAEIEHYRNNDIKAVEKLNSLLDEKDEKLLEKVKNLLGKIYYYGSNEIKKDHKKAFDYFCQSEREISSKEHIGKSYFYGYGVEKNYQKAFEVFKDIENNSRLALFYLGEMYRLGCGVSTNFEQAYNYYKKSAEKNYPQAQYHLGQAYLLGEGITADVEKALFWFEKSAQYEYRYAMYVLGMLYYYGKNEGYNIPENKELAIKWFEKAIKEGSKDAKRELEKIQSGSHYFEKANDNENNSDIISDVLRHIDNADTKDSN